VQETEPEKREREREREKEVSAREKMGCTCKGSKWVVIMAWLVSRWVGR